MFNASLFILSCFCLCGEITDHGGHQEGLSKTFSACLETNDFSKKAEEVERIFGEVCDEYDQPGDCLDSLNEMFCSETPFGGFENATTRKFIDKERMLSKEYVRSLCPKRQKLELIAKRFEELRRAIESCDLVVMCPKSRRMNEMVGLLWEAQQKYHFLGRLTDRAITTGAIKLLCTECMCEVETPSSVETGTVSEALTVAEVAETGSSTTLEAFTEIAEEAEETAPSTPPEAFIAETVSGTVPEASTVIVAEAFTDTRTAEASTVIVAEAFIAETVPSTTPEAFTDTRTAEASTVTAEEAFTDTRTAEASTVIAEEAFTDTRTAEASTVIAAEASTVTTAESITEKGIASSWDFSSLVDLFTDTKKFNVDREMLESRDTGRPKRDADLEWWAANGMLNGLRNEEPRSVTNDAPKPEQTGFGLDEESFRMVMVVLAGIAVGLMFILCCVFMFKKKMWVDARH